MAPYRPENQPLYFLKSVLLLIGIFASITIGFPYAGLGIAGVFGQMADASYVFNLRMGLLYLGISAGIWSATFICGLWWNGKLSQRFGLRSVLVAFTAAAIVAAAVSAWLRIPISS